MKNIINYINIYIYMSKDFTDCFSNSKLLKMIKENNIDLKEEYIKILKRYKYKFGKNKDIIYRCYYITELKNIILDNNLVSNKSDLKGLKKKDLVQILKDNNIKIDQLPLGKKVKKAPERIKYKKIDKNIINEFKNKLNEIQYNKVKKNMNFVIDELKNKINENKKIKKMMKDYDIKANQEYNNKIEEQNKKEEQIYKKLKDQREKELYDISTISNIKETLELLKIQKEHDILKLNQEYETKIKEEQTKKNNQEKQFIKNQIQNRNKEINNINSGVKDTLKLLKLLQKK